MKTQIDMKNLGSIPANGYSVISTFSGCGGSSLGYKLAGYSVLSALEFIPNAYETYKANFPNTKVIEKDIRDINGEFVMEVSGIKKYELDILDGSPPCSDFSVNGKREKGWGLVKNYSSTKQRVDDLFFEYARIVKDIQPKVLIAENVKGLTVGKAKEVLAKVLSTLTDAGYEVAYRVLDASDFEVPQKRERTIIIGVRKDLVEKYGVHPVFPKPLGYKISCREAIEDLMDKGTDQPPGKAKRDVLMKEYFHAGCTAMDIKKICKANNLKVYEQTFRRDKWNEPYYTIKQHHTRPFHPMVDRVMSIGEAKRIQTFPDDFKLLHSPIQNWERIGRAVPPNLMKHIAKTVQLEILDKIK